MAPEVQVKLGHTLSTNFDFIPDWANQFYQAKKSEGVSTFTLTFYKQQLGHFLRYCDSQVVTKLGELTPAILRQFILWHSETGHNSGGCHAAFRVLRTFLLWFESETDSVTAIHKIHAPKLPEKILDPANLNDIFSMVKTCKGDSPLDARDGAVILLLADTGIRARELTRLDLIDFNFLDGSIEIRHGKGNKGRTVFLGKTGRKAMRIYLKHRTDTNPALFVTDDFQRLGYPGLRKIFVKRAGMAQVTRPPLHALRRQFALAMLRNGTDIFTLAKLMGHSDIKVLKQYLAISKEDLKQAQNRASPVDRFERK